MERKFLEQFEGLDKEAIDKIMDANSADIGKAKKPGETANERVAELEAQLADVGEKLKAFDGVDVDGMKGQIADLTANIDTIKAESAQKLADRDFMDLLNGEITSAKGINPKAVSALLDVDTLKASKNQKEDIAAAVKALAESDAYLFKSDNPPPKFTQPSGGGGVPLEKALKDMSYKEELALKQADPERYKSMKEGE